MEKIEKDKGLWPALSMLALIVQPLIFYRRHLFWLTAHIPFDIVGFHLPLSSFIERSLERGQWPLWSPLEYCGMPIHADIQAQLFYPLTWLAILADLLTGATRLLYWLEWLVAIHMIVAGIGAYFLLRRLRCSPLVSLFGATVFQIGPFFVSQAEHLGAISAGAWLPTVFLCVLHLVEKFNSRWFAGLALSITMVWLGGFPAVVTATIVLAFVFCVGLVALHVAKRHLLLLVSAGIMLGTAIAAVQLIPTIQLSRLSVASLRYTWMGNGGGYHWQALMSFVWPNYYHIFEGWDPAIYKLPYPYTFMYTFCGYAAVALLLLAPLILRRSKFLSLSLILFFISTVWLLGESTPIYPAIFKSLPTLVQNAMYPEYVLPAFSLFASIAAALVLAEFDAQLPSGVLLVLVIANSWNLIRTGANRIFNTFPDSYETATAWRPLPRTLQAETLGQTPPVRIDFMSDNPFLEQGKPAFLGLVSATGDNPFALLRYYHLRRLFANDVEWSRKQLVRGLDDPLLRMLNVGYVVDDRKSHPVADPLPRFTIRSNVIRVRDEADGLNRIRSSSFDPMKDVIVEGLSQSWEPDSSASGTVDVVKYENNRVELDSATTGRSLLVTSEAMYPGWKATVNGVPANIVMVNVAFRGIPLEAGRNHIVMTYLPTNLLVSATITTLALILTALIAIAGPVGAGSSSQLPTTSGR